MTPTEIDRRELKLDAKEILQASSAGRELDGDEFALMQTVFMRHPKTPPSARITRIRVDKQPARYKIRNGAHGKCFWVTTDTEPEAPWSYLRCFDKSPEIELARDARLLIEASIDAFRKHHHVCERCGATHGIQVHHDGVPFRAILGFYLDLHGPDLSGFRLFHDSIATLQALCADCHKQAERDNRS